MAGQYSLPEELRAELAVPLGKLFRAQGIEGGELMKVLKGASFVVTVGDRVTETVGGMGRVPDVQIVDCKENRKPRDPPLVTFKVSLRAHNPAGTITMEGIERIRDAFAGEKPARVTVDGEEDLLAIPAIVLAPRSARVFYGQPGAGIVLVIADEDAKGRSMALLKRMGIPDSVISPNR